MSESLGRIDVPEVITQELFPVSSSCDKGEDVAQSCCWVGCLSLNQKRDSLNSFVPVALEDLMECPNGNGGYSSVVSISLILLTAGGLCDLVGLGYVSIRFYRGHGRRWRDNDRHDELA